MKNTSLARLLALSVYMAALAVAAPAALSQTVDPPADHPYGASQPVPGRYIVVFKDHVANPAAEAANLMRGTGGQLHHVYSSAIKGFAASLPAAALQGIQNNPNVDFIEQDQTVSLNDAETGTTQTGATWGLDRIDQRDRSPDTSYHYHYMGTSVYAFIIDTGIRAHQEFGLRLKAGFDAIEDGNGTDDCHSHGTHVAGTVGGTTWGVAKNVSLVPVRVLDCSGSGTWSQVIAGVDWVAQQKTNDKIPAVANMSLGGGASTAVDNAVAGAVKAGVTVVVAAGNSNADACKYSPARAPSAVTLGATTSADARASYSNWGTCLSMFAPGSSITSASNSSPTASSVKSGTSMASPHVAGVAALALEATTAASPAAVNAFLTDGASSGKLTDVKTSPNLLVYSLAEGSPADPTVHVHDIVGSSSRVGRNWRAYADVTIRRYMVDGTEKAVPNATVTGEFSPGGGASCVTGKTGTCRLSSATIDSKTTSTVFTVNSVSGWVLIYHPSVNHVITTITIAKP